MYKSQCYESFLPFWHLSYWWNYKTAQFIDECIEYILFWRFFAIQLRVNDLFAMTTFFWQNNCNKIYIDANFVRIKIKKCRIYYEKNVIFLQERKNEWSNCCQVSEQNFKNMISLYNLKWKCKPIIF